MIPPRVHVQGCPGMPCGCFPTPNPRETVHEMCERLNVGHGVHPDRSFGLVWSGKLLRSSETSTLTEAEVHGRTVLAVSSQSSAQCAVCSCMRCRKFQRAPNSAADVEGRMSIPRRATVLPMVPEPHCCSRPQTTFVSLGRHPGQQGSVGEVAPSQQELIWAALTLHNEGCCASGHGDFKLAHALLERGAVVFSRVDDELLGLSDNQGQLLLDLTWSAYEIKDKSLLTVSKARLHKARDLLYRAYFGQPCSILSKHAQPDYDGPRDPRATAALLRLELLSAAAALYDDDLPSSKQHLEDAGRHLARLDVQADPLYAVVSHVHKCKEPAANENAESVCLCSVLPDCVQPPNADILSNDYLGPADEQGMVWICTLSTFTSCSSVSDEEVELTEASCKERCTSECIQDGRPSWSRVALAAGALRICNQDVDHACRFCDDVIPTALSALKVVRIAELVVSWSEEGDDDDIEYLDENNNRAHNPTESPFVSCAQPGAWRSPCCHCSDLLASHDDVVDAPDCMPTYMDSIEHIDVGPTDNCYGAPLSDVFLSQVSLVDMYSTLFVVPEHSYDTSTLGSPRLGSFEAHCQEHCSHSPARTQALRKALAIAETVRDLQSNVGQCALCGCIDLFHCGQELCYINMASDAAQRNPFHASTCAANQFQVNEVLGDSSLLVALESGKMDITRERVVYNELMGMVQQKMQAYK